jgi:hypothetical protein
MALTFAIHSLPTGEAAIFRKAFRNYRFPHFFGRVVDEHGRPGGRYKKHIDEYCDQPERSVQPGPFFAFYMSLLTLGNGFWKVRNSS